MDIAAPPRPDPLPPPAPPAPDDPPVIGGVARQLAAAFAVDPTWVRIGFVILALFGGIGVALYAGLWLMWREHATIRLIGGIVAVGGTVVLLTVTGSTVRFDRGPLTVVALLIGLAVALWQPRREVTPPPPRVPSFTPPVSPATDDGALEDQPETSHRVAATAGHRSQVGARRADRSPLGRAVIGLAVVIAAAGGIIDAANGGRYHPEQWLGAAALVCGLGLILGSWRGRALWLVLPAVLFAGGGRVAGEMAAMGIGFDHLDMVTYHSVGSTGSLHPGGSVRQAVGEVYLTVEPGPASGDPIDVRLGIGTVWISVLEDVAVEVRARTDHGEATAGLRDDHPSGTVLRTTGGGDTPPIVIDVWVWWGDVHLAQHSSDPDDPPVDLESGPLATIAPIDTPTGALGPVEVYPDVIVSGDGWILYGDVAVDPDDRLMYFDGLEWVPTDVTSFNDVTILPGGILRLPDGALLEIERVRQVADVARDERNAATNAPPEPTAVPIDPSSPTTTTTP